MKTILLNFFAAELGDYDDLQHSAGYVSEFRFVAAQSEEMENDVEYAHASMAGMGITPATAEMTYLEKVKWLDMYGVDLHPVQVRQPTLTCFQSCAINFGLRSKLNICGWPD